MSQVRHADSMMTMDDYAQLRRRGQREHGRAFDGLVRQAVNVSCHAGGSEHKLLSDLFRGVRLAAPVGLARLFERALFLLGDRLVVERRVSRRPAITGSRSRRLAMYASVSSASSSL